MEVDARIEKFIAKHHVLTLATATLNDNGESEPYCSNMFYVYEPSSASFVFTSSDDTFHVQQMISNSNVAGSIVLETTIVGKLQGLQFRGTISRADDAKFGSLYINRYPFAVLADLNLWVLQLTDMKFTDNRLGFGKKIKWSRNE